MKIQVIEKIGTVGDIYNVAINKKVNYRISGQTIPFMTNFSLYELKSSNPLVSIFKSSLSLFPKYKIYFNSERINPRKEPLIFKTTSYFKNSFKLEFDKDIYEFYAHKKLKYSIFKNGQQVAGICQDRWNIMDEDGFMMECNNDSPKELFTSFIIVLDNIYRRRLNLFGGLVNANIGIIWEDKEYDTNWMAR